MSSGAECGLRHALWAIGLAALLGAAAAPRQPSPASGPPPQAAVKPAPPAAAEPAKRDGPPPLVLEDKPEWLAPAKPRSESERDRLEALALFSAARIRENRQDYAAALRLYQRAFRCDPRSATIARAIVPLAVRLDRHSEAVRYALKLVDLEDADPVLLKRLGVYLTETGDWSQALALFEKAETAENKGKPTAQDVILWMEMGRLYHLTGQHAKAAARFRQVLDALDKPEQFGLDAAAKKVLLSQPRLAFALMGESLLRAGQPEKAAAVFEKSHQAEPSKGLLAYQLAEVDLKLGKPEQALQRLQACFDERLASEEAGPYQLLAEILKALHKEGELIARLEKLRAADPGNLYLAYFLADKYFEAQRFDQAEKLYREAMAKKPAMAGYRNLLQIDRRNKNYDDLLKVLGDAVSKIGSLEPLAPKGQPLAGDAELVRGVVDAARKQLKAGPEKLAYEARVAVAILSAEAKQPDTAAEFYELAIRAKPDQASRLLLSWGLGLLLRDEHARAVKVFQRGIDEKALGADDPTFHFYLAGALEMAGQTEAALASARKAADLAARRQAASAGEEKKAARVEFARHASRPAWILYHAKRYAEASKAYQEFLDKFGSDYSSGEIRKAVREARLVLSNIAVLQGDMPAAEQRLELVLDEFPDDASALNDLGYLWADQGKHLERAHRMIRQAVEKEPENAAYRDSLGWVLFRRGKVREAIPELEKAAAAEPDPTVLEHLGDAYRADGQAEKAAQWWRKAADAYRKAHEEEKAKNVEQKMKPPP